MAGEAARRYQLALEASGAAPPATPPTFEALDLESASGRYHTVTCLDVMIHYPQVRAGAPPAQPALAAAVPCFCALPCVRMLAGTLSDSADSGSCHFFPQTKADGMIKHLAGLADERLIISFAPYTPYYAVLKRIGELFPGPSKVPP